MATKLTPNGNIGHIINQATAAAAAQRVSPFQATVQGAKAVINKKNAQITGLIAELKAIQRQATNAAQVGQAGQEALNQLRQAFEAVINELRGVTVNNRNISTNAPLAAAIEAGITAALAANDVPTAAIDAATAAMTHVSMNTPEKRAVAAGIAAYKGMMAKHAAMVAGAAAAAPGGAGAGAPAAPNQDEKNTAIAVAMVRGYRNNDADHLVAGSGHAVRALIPQVVAAVGDLNVTTGNLEAILEIGQMGLQGGGAKKRRSTKKKSTSTKKKSTSTKKKSTSTKKKSTSTKKKSTKGRK
jgi:hypothetical protein